jgi:hypothetical protein
MELPEILGVKVDVAPANFDVTEPMLKIHLEFAEGPGRLIADRHRALLRVPNGGTFVITHGSRISFAPDENASANRVAVWLHGHVAALLLAQRGLFALHASVVDVAGIRVAIAGPSGLGKTTTALRLMQLGHGFVTDDVSPLEGHGPVIVHPTGRPLYVTPDAAAALGLDLSQASVLPGDRKLIVPTTPRPAAPIAAIAVLSRQETAAKVDARPVVGGEAHSLVREHVFSAQVVDLLWRNEVFAWAAAISGSVSVYELVRPRAGWSVNEVASVVERIAERHRRGGGESRPAARPALAEARRSTARPS